MASGFWVYYCDSRTPSACVSLYRRCDLGLGDKMFINIFEQVHIYLAVIIIDVITGL